MIKTGRTVRQPAGRNRPPPARGRVHDGPGRTGNLAVSDPGEGGYTGAHPVPDVSRRCPRWPEFANPCPTAGRSGGGAIWVRLTRERDGPAMGAALRRRRFLQSASALGLGAGLGDGPPAGDHARRGRRDGVGPDAVRFRPEIEPVVRWIEETPRDAILDVAVDHLKRGLSYRDLLAGLFLAGIRNIKPSPVGFKFHAVMVINSAHLLGQTAAGRRPAAAPVLGPRQLQELAGAGREGGGLDARQGRRGPPAHARPGEGRIRQGDGRLGRRGRRRRRRRPLPDRRARPRRWSRSGGMAVRDQRNIGHKPIFAAQSWRTLQAIGWQHAEPVLRSLAFGLLDLHGDSRHVPVGPYEANLENAAKVRDGWQVGKPDPAATRALLEALRQASPRRPRPRPSSCSTRASPPTRSGTPSSSPASELMMRNPGIVAIHATTSANALHYIYGASGDDTTRKLALLQAVGWQPLYRGRLKPAGAPTIDALEPIAPDAAGDEAVGEIFDDDRARTGARPPRKALGYLAGGGSPDAPLRRRPPDDLPQGPRQPRLQVRRRRLGGMPPRLRPQVAGPPRRRRHVQPAPAAPKPMPDSARYDESSRAPRRPDSRTVDFHL